MVIFDNSFTIYVQVCAELEDEKKRHAQDTEDGDNVTCMLEKERERLKQEVECPYWMFIIFVL